MVPSIQIHNVGPVKEFQCELAPGVTVLMGDQGVGKTTILRTVQLASGTAVDRKPMKSDGVKAGEAVVAGRTLTISKTTRSEGDLTVEGLGELSLDVLHTPRYEAPAIRDKHRIATLVRLAGVKADPILFHPLVGGRENFNKLVDSDSVKTDDLVDMGGRIKRRLEKHAVEYEKRHQTAVERFAAERRQAEGVDIEQPDDAVELGGALQDAVAARAKIIEQRNAADRAAHVANDAQKRREALPEAKDVASLDTAYRESEVAVQDATQAVSIAKEALRKAEESLTSAKYTMSTRFEILQSAMREAQYRDELDRTIADAVAVDRPTDADIEAADRAVSAAQDAIEVGARVRFAKAALTRAEGEQANAKAAEAAAKSMRVAAGGTQTVLTDAISRIPNCPLRVIFDADGDARLVVSTDRSDAELFDDLSDGQRWRVVLDIAAAQDKLVVLSQAAWGELSDGTRTQIDTMARERGCYILTAQADDGKLRAETWAKRAEAVAA